MKGSQWIKTIPTGPGDAREAAILQAVKDRHIVVHWNPIYADVGNSRAMFLVSNALQVGEPGDSVRVSTSHRNAQWIADELNSVLPTQRLADLSYHYAKQKIAPQTSDVGDMSTAHMLRQSQRLDALIEPDGTLVANEGKFWLTNQKLVTEPVQDGQPSAVNYGWFVTKSPGYGHDYRTTLPGVMTIQGPYTGHGYKHDDYSQLVYLVARRVEVCHPAGVAGLGDDAGGWACTLPDGSEGVTSVYDMYRMIDEPGLKDFFTPGDPSLNIMRHPSVDWESSEVMAFDPFTPARPPQAGPPTQHPPDYPPGYAPAEPLSAGVGRTGKAAALVAGAALGFYGTQLLSDWWWGD